MRDSVKISRVLTAAVATVAALGTSALVAAPAHAASSFSESSGAGASWGTVSFGSYSWSVNAYILRDSNASVTLRVCGRYSEYGAWYTLTCKSASNGGAVGSTRHVTDLGSSANWARVGAVTTELYVNGTYVDGDWNYV
jgi:hypothetical protein